MQFLTSVSIVGILLIGVCSAYDAISKPVLDCSTVFCAQVACFGAEVLPGQCCPTCPPDCSAVLCPQPECLNPVTPKGQCCPICEKPDCSAVSCLIPICPGGSSFTPEGECCPQCGPDCSLVSCPKPYCPDGELFTPPGECCPQCGPFNPCSPYGEPLVDSTGTELFCGRGPTSVECPDDSNCVIDPLDRFAVCCPDPCATATLPDYNRPGGSQCALADCIQGLVCLEDSNLQAICCPVQDPCGGECSEFEVCIVEQVMCVVAPCPPIVSCQTEAQRCERATDPDYSQPGGSPCSYTKCGDGKQCKEDINGNFVCCKPKTTEGCTDEDGTFYPEGDIPDNDPCYGCSCERQTSGEYEIICWAFSCPYPGNCEEPVAPEGECCAVCPQGCTDADGTFYPEGDISDNDPCTGCSCERQPSGDYDIICWVQDCAPPQCDQPVQLDGVCCGQCGCLDDDGNFYYPGEEVKVDDPCSFNCRCNEFLGEYSVSCAVVDCRPASCDDPVLLPDQCCEQCGCRDDEGNFFPVGDIDDDNPCQICHCSNTGEIFCAVYDCPFLPCGGDYEYLPDQCCPVCNNPGCVDDDGNFFPVGEIPDNDACKTCHCVKINDWEYGIICSAIACAQPECDHTVVLPGDCCSTCGCTDANGKPWPLGEVESSHPCEHCYCSEDSAQVQCYVQGCPAPACFNNYVPEGQCCPVCPSCKKYDDCRVEVAGQILGNCCNPHKCVDNDDPGSLPYVQDIIDCGYYDYCLEKTPPAEFGCCGSCSKWAKCENRGKNRVLFNGQTHGGSGNRCRCTPCWEGDSPDPSLEPFTCEPTKKKRRNVQ